MEPSTSRGRGRGGRGKALRARGRRGTGRPAEWGNRPIPDAEADGSEDEKERLQEERKWAHRGLASNADRYEMPDSKQADEEPEPEVDLSAFLARQRGPEPITPTEHPKRVHESEAIEDVDQSLSHLPTSTRPAERDKPRVQVVEWNEDMEKMWREKQKAEAVQDLKSRFKGDSHGGSSKKINRPPQAPARADGGQSLSSAGNDEEAFLDELLG